jgi:hypothetical protein
MGLSHSFLDNLCLEGSSAVVTDVSKFLSSYCIDDNSSSSLHSSPEQSPIVFVVVGKAMDLRLVGRGSVAVGAGDVCCGGIGLGPVDCI